MLLILLLNLLHPALAEEPVFWVDSLDFGSPICREVLRTEYLSIDAKPIIYEQLQRTDLLERAPDAKELAVLIDYFLSKSHPLVSHFGTYLQLLSQAGQLDSAYDLATQYFTHWFGPPRQGFTIPARFGISQSGIPIAVAFISAGQLRRFFQHGGEEWINRWKIKKLFLSSSSTTRPENSYTAQDIGLLKALPSLEEIEFTPHYRQSYRDVPVLQLVRELSSIPSLKTLVLRGVQPDQTFSLMPRFPALNVVRIPLAPLNLQR